MNADDRFDAVTRAAADGVSRRGLMRMLAGGVAGGTVLTAFGGGQAWGAGNACLTNCRQSTMNAKDRAACMRVCNSCHGRDRQVCWGGEGPVCCESDESCCSSHIGAMCCPAGSHCCIGRKGALRCCPDEMECCGGGCCAPGQCCHSGLPFSVTCCPTGETCCFDPDLFGGTSRCGTIDATTGYCVPL